MRKIRSINPATEEELGEVASSSSQEVRKAVNRARTGFASWSETPIQKRTEVIKRAGKLLEEKTDELAELMSKEVGKTLESAKGEISEAVSEFEYFASHGSVFLETEEVKVQEMLPHKKSFIIHEPLGVIGVIKAWNYPLVVPSWSIAPALIAGNTVVFKPSELVPFFSEAYVKLLHQAGLPEEALTILQGGSEVGKTLVQSDVDMISFTGNTKTGKNIMKDSAPKLHRLSFELGGKDPMLVLEDADLELASNGAVWGSFSLCGQVCTAVERVYVHQSLAEEFARRVVEKTRALKVGNPLHDDTDIGPLVSEKQREKVEEQVKDAVKKGAEIRVGGEKKQGKGFFFSPTVLTSVNHDMKVMTEETFGPLMPIQVFKDEEEAIRLANNTKYGLGASVWTEDQEKGRIIANRLQAGMVWVNDVNIAFPNCPWTGIKESGPGIELSKYGFLEFTTPKHVCIDYGEEKTRDWWYSKN